MKIYLLTQIHLLLGITALGGFLCGLQLGYEW